MNSKERLALWSCGRSCRAFQILHLALFHSHLPRRMDHSMAGSERLQKLGQDGYIVLFGKHVEQEKDCIRGQALSWVHSRRACRSWHDSNRGITSWDAGHAAIWVCTLLMHFSYGTATSCSCFPTSSGTSWGELLRAVRSLSRMPTHPSIRLFVSFNICDTEATFAGIASRMHVAKMSLHRFSCLHILLEFAAFLR